MSEEKRIDSRSSKGEVLKAYRELLEKVKDENKRTPQEEKKRKDEAKTVETAVQNSAEKIVKSISELKLGLGRTLDSLGEDLGAEFTKLSELRQAVEVEERALEEVHQITVEADSLSALLRAQEEERKEFENEMEEKKLQWKKEQEEYALSIKEERAQLEKDKKREEEEYNYKLQTQRRKEKDQYEEEKEAFEKELAAREEDFAQKEKEYAQLKAEVEGFPQELEKAVKEAEKALSEKLTLQHKHEAELLAKEIEGEQRLNKQVVAALELKIKEQAEQISQLSQRLNEAGKQVHNMALKALEVPSISREVRGAGVEKGKE